MLGSADALEQLVGAKAVGAGKALAGLGHDREVRRACGRVGRKVVRRGGGAVLAGFGVDHGQGLGIGLDLLFGQTRAADIGQRTDAHELQPMAGRADLGIDLQAALQLMLVKGSKRAFKAEGDIGDARFLCRPGSAGEQGQSGNSADCDFAYHLSQSLSLTQPGRRSAT